MALLKGLALELASAAIEKVIHLVLGKPAPPEPEPPHPGFTDIEHQRAVMNQSIAASKARGKLPPKGGPHG